MDAPSWAEIAATLTALAPVVVECEPDGGNKLCIVSVGKGYKRALLREIREETGLRKVKIICQLPPEVFYTHEKIHGQTASMQRAFLVEYASGKIKLSREHSSFRWVDKKTAMKLLTHNGHKTFLTAADKTLREARRKRMKSLIEKLSKKHATLVKFSGGHISLRYDGKKLSNKVVKERNKDVGSWSKKKNIVYYDRDLALHEIVPILIHETVEKYMVHEYGMDEYLEAHKVAQAVERDFIADRGWLSHQELVARDWVKANKQKIGKNKFY